MGCVFCASGMNGVTRNLTTAEIVEQLLHTLLRLGFGADLVRVLRHRRHVEGRVRSVEIRPVEQNSVLATEIADSTGELTALFYGRSRIPGLMCGSRVRLRGPVGIKGGAPVMVNPAYELIVPYGSGQPAPDGE